MCRGSEFIIQGLLNSCTEDSLVSEIYELKGQLNNAEKEYSLELSLGLIDVEGTLLVDYDYYKWTIINYKPEQHDYFKNCITKHIKKQNDKFNKINDVSELSQEEYDELISF